MKFTILFIAMVIAVMIPLFCICPILVVFLPMAIVGAIFGTLAFNPNDEDCGNIIS